jgi:penicillin-binding protein 1C
LKKIVVAFVAGAAILLALAACLVFRPEFRPLPAFREVRASYRPSEARLLDRRGGILHALRVDRTVRCLEWTPLSDISPALVRAVVRSEDKRFHEHAGVDWIALTGAAADALAHGGRRGASTVTMQLASVLEGRTGGRTPRRSLRRKVLQIREALALERSWGKEEILEAYLNLIDFRGELRGVRAAARGLFGKDPGGLNDAEAIVLASLIRSPNAGEPDVLRRALRLAVALGSPLPSAGIELLVRETLVRPYAIAPEADFAPHVARLLLGERGSEVHSTLDAEVQRFAMETLARQLLFLREKNVGDGAVLVVANRTGEILAYVGNAGPLSSARYVDGIAAPRQAGSTLKPFLYGLALERRLLTGASLLDDSPIDVPTAMGSYAPRNYDRGYRGLVSLRTALASSLNVPAVRTCLLVSPDAFAVRLRQLGFDGVGEGEDHGASLALGSVDLTLFQLVNAYRALANGGMWSPLTFVPRGKPPGTRRVLSREAAFVTSDILADRAAREATFGLENLLSMPFWTAVKTGTSKDMRDNWCIGFSRDFTVGAWVGNFAGDPMWNVSGMSGAAPVWAEVMTFLHRGRPGASPPPPPGVVPLRVSFPGHLEGERTEWFLRGTEPPRPGQAVARSRSPRIRFPSSGMIVALDPDIPEGRQLLYLEARDGAAGHTLALDGTPVGSPDRLIPWRPEAGMHNLVLLDGSGAVVDNVTFSVRGRNAVSRKASGE